MQLCVTQFDKGLVDSVFVICGLIKITVDRDYDYFEYHKTSIPVNFIIIWLVPRAGKMSWALRCDWLPERARWALLTRSGLPTIFLQICCCCYRRCCHIIKPLLTKLVQPRWRDIGIVLFFFFFFFLRVYGSR